MSMGLHIDEHEEDTPKERAYRQQDVKPDDVFKQKFHIEINSSPPDKARTQNSILTDFDDLNTNSKMAYTHRASELNAN